MNGRKRHILVDTMGLLLKARALPADGQDRAGAMGLLHGIRKLFPRLELIRADQNYRGEDFHNWMAQVCCVLKVVNRKPTWQWMIEEGRIVRKKLPREPKTFEILPRRWAVERTFGWFGRNRRLSRDYESRCPSEEAWIYLAMSHLMLKRLAL